MKNRERLRERYLRDAWPTRLAGLAASLGRVASGARRATGGAATLALLEECQYFIEWTAADMPLELAAELVDMQVLLALWRRAWPEAQHSATQRSLLAVQAAQWTERILRYVPELAQ
jgi:hypothetical protein